MTRGPLVPLATVTAALLALAACSKPKATPPADTDASALALDDKSIVDAGPPKVLPARCKAEGRGAKVPGTAPEDLEIGEAVPYKGGFAIGVLRKTDAGLVGSIGIASADLGKVAWIDLAAPYGDAPPPRPAVAGNDLYAALYVRPAPKKPSDPAGKETRDLSIFKIDEAKGAAAVTVVVPQQNDESLAYDLAFPEKGGAGLVVWDEDAIGLVRGDIQVALLSPDAQKVASTRIASGEMTDAELPRVVARKGGGFWAVWVVNKLEVEPPKIDAAAGKKPSAEGPPPEIEGPGEARAFHWLEAMSLDERGAQRGHAIRLTSATGHVSAFDLATRADGETLDVLARDDDQRADGTGGRILRIAVSEGKADAPLAIVSEAVGRAVPDLLVSPASPRTWLAYSDDADKLRLVPLDDARAPLAAPSLEDALDHARPLAGAAFGGGGAPPNHATAALLAAFPEDDRAELRIVPCNP